MRRLTRAGTSMPDPGNTDTRMRSFASALGRFPVTLLTTSDGTAVTHHLVTPARHDFPNAALSLSHAVGAQIDVVDEPPDLSGTRVVGFLRADARAPAVHATTRGGDTAETARRVETALRHRTDDTTWVAATPAAAILKGVDGPDWALACVLMDVQVAIRTDARMGYGFCARMQWSPTEQRWLIAAGTPPAAAPSTWPGSQAAAAAGWLSWAEELER